MPEAKLEWEFEIFVTLCDRHVFRSSPQGGDYYDW